MKKSLVFVFILSILVLSLSFSSAGFFENLFGKNTGNAIVKLDSKYFFDGKELILDKELKSSCTDSDEGLFPYDFGYVVQIVGNLSSHSKDYCINGNLLKENYCNLTVPGFEYFNCSYGCENGACLLLNNSDFCSDSDDGLNYGVYGIVNYFMNGNYGSMLDNCSGNDYLQEAYCIENITPSYDYHFCENGCFAGVCMEENNTNLTFCTDSDGGINPFVFGVIDSSSWNTSDFCYSSILLNEFYCQADNSVEFEMIPCENGCLNGTCIEESNNSFCTDTDGGINYDLFGMVNYTDGNESGYFIDSCNGTYYLNENYCSGITPGHIQYFCEDGCYNGACSIGGSGSNGSIVGCVDSDGGIVPSVFGIVNYTNENNSGIIADFCESDFILNENYCNQNLLPMNSFINCSSGCFNGTCIFENSSSSWSLSSGRESKSIVGNILRFIFGRR